MWQLRKNLKSWWCGNPNVNYFDYFPVWCDGHAVRGYTRCLENISSTTVICGMTYSKHLYRSLRCLLHFFHLSFYSSFSFSWAVKNDVIFLHCNRNITLEITLEIRQEGTSRFHLSVEWTLSLGARSFFLFGEVRKSFSSLFLSCPKKKTSDTQGKWTSAFKGFMYEDTAIFCQCVSRQSALVLLLRHKMFL